MHARSLWKGIPRCDCVLTLALCTCLLTIDGPAEALTIFSADFQKSVPAELCSGSLGTGGIGAEVINQGLSQYLGSFTLAQSTR